MVEIRTLTPNRFKNQSGDTMNILGQNCNHQQGFAKQRTVALHSGFKLKFLNAFNKSLLLVNFINVTVVTQNWDNFG